VQAERPFGAKALLALIKLAAAGHSHDDPATDKPGDQIEQEFQKLDQPMT
jgi:hypothetical protein